MPALKNIIENKTLIKVLVFSFYALVFSFFAFSYNYHLFFKEQMQLFMLTSEHFFSYFTKPASIACYLGDFFTQFYYLKGGGAIVITINLALLHWLLNKLIFKLGKSKLLGIFPVFLIILSALLHANVFYSLGSTISFILCTLFALGYTFIKKETVRLIIGLIIIPILYYVLGAYIIIYSIFLFIYEVRKKTLSKALRISFFLLLLLTTISTPLIFRTNFHITKTQAFIYPNNKNVKPKLNFELEKLLSLDSEWYFNRPEKVLELAKKHNLNNKYASFYYNLANAANNQLPDGLLQAYQPGTKGLFISVDKSENFMTIAFSNELYFLLGDINASQHFSLLATTFSPKTQSSRMLRRLVESNIINGEYQVAEKYIKMLEKTWFHKRWASEMSLYLYNEEECKKNGWIVQKRAQIPKFDYIKKGPNNFVNTLKHLLENHPDSKICRDYLLCTYLLNKDLSSFYKYILEETNAKRINSLPILYQEALMIYFAQNINDNNKSLFKISPALFKNFLTYTDIYASNKGNGKALQEQYGKTYWFYYHYATFQNQQEK